MSWATPQARKNVRDRIARPSREWPDGFTSRGHSRVAGRLGTPASQPMITGRAEDTRDGRGTGSRPVRGQGGAEIRWPVGPLPPSKPPHRPRARPPPTGNVRPSDRLRSLRRPAADLGPVAAARPYSYAKRAAEASCRVIRLGAVVIHEYPAIA